MEHLTLLQKIRLLKKSSEASLQTNRIRGNKIFSRMKQYSPARLTRPLRRIRGAERGDSQFEAISWDEAFGMLEERLRKIRAEDPKRFALFTGRDQMQALTGMFAKQFGTPNYAAYGGFCSVNLAAGLIYTIGGSFWEFGGPDLERAKLFVMIGTAEDHHSNPLKIALSKFKRRGGKFVSINPIRTGYSAIADEWVPIKPGTDGALLLAIIHEIIKQGLYDREFLIQYTNAAELVVDDETRDDHGLFHRVEMHIEEGCFDPENKLWWDGEIGPIGVHTPGADPRLMGAYELERGIPVKPGFQLLKERVEEYTPEWAAGAWGLSPKADESRKGFLLNHLIAEELPPCESGEHLSNSDPVTGQAAWFDVRVRVYRADAGEPAISSPQFAPQSRVPGQDKRRGKWQAYVAGMFNRKSG